MNWLEFFSSIVNSLAWPLFALIIILILKNPLIERITELKSFKAKGVEIDFHQKLKNLIETQVEEDSQINEVDKVWSPEIDKKIERLAKIDPSASIIYAWTELETTLRNFEILMDGKNYKHVSVNELMKRAINQGILQDNNYKVFKELNILRNEVVHGRRLSDNLSYNDAMNYVEVVKQVIHELNTSINQPQ